MADEYTPTTGEVREGYGRQRGGWYAQLAAEFDRWLAAEIAQAEKRGAVMALREVIDALGASIDDRLRVDADRGHEFARAFIACTALDTRIVSALAARIEAGQETPNA